MHTLGSTLYHFHANCRSLHWGNARQRAFAATLRRRGAQRPQTLSIMPFSTLPQRLPLQERTVRDVAFQAARELFTIVATSLSTVFQCCRRAMPSSCDARGNPRASHGDGSTRTRLQVTERHQLPSGISYRALERIGSGERKGPRSEEPTCTCDSSRRGSIHRQGTLNAVATSVEASWAPTRASAEERSARGLARARGLAALCVRVHAAHEWRGRN